MTLILLIIYFAVSMYAGYFATDEQYFTLTQLNECIILYCLLLNVTGLVRAIAAMFLLLAAFELLDDLRHINTQLFIGDIFLNIIATSYLIIRWQKLKTKY